MSEYLIISFDVYNNPMCTTTHTVIKIILCYPYHFFDLRKTQLSQLYPNSLYPVNYIIIGRCFIYKIAPNRGTPLNDEFLPNSSPFPLIVFLFCFWEDYHL